MNKRHVNTYGVNTNVSLDPTSNAASMQSINNNITIQTNPNDKPAVAERSMPDPLFPSVRTTDSTTIAEPVETDYAVNEVPNYTVSYPKVDTGHSATNTININSKLRDIFGRILLSDNKVLLSNILTKNSIIIAKNDLEDVIKLRINKTCSIIIDDTDDQCACLRKATSIYKIASIRIVDDNSSVDFKAAYNAEYNDLVDNYKLNLVYVFIGK